MKCGEEMRSSLCVLKIVFQNVRRRSLNENQPLHYQTQAVHIFFVSPVFKPRSNERTKASGVKMMTCVDLFINRLTFLTPCRLNLKPIFVNGKGLCYFVVCLASVRLCGPSDHRA